MSFIIGVFVFIVLICISISLHEFGHFFFAKKFNAYISEYMVGFGKVLVSKKKDETTYGIKAILLGGYVKILGMFAPGKADRKIYDKKGRITLAEQARIASLEELPKDHTHRAFYRLSVSKKIIVLIAGPMMNLFLCILSVVVAVNIIGIKQPSTVVDNVHKCIVTNSKNTDSNNCENKSPAYLAGIKSGDKILSVDNHLVKSWSDLSNSIARSKAKVTEIEVERKGKKLRFNLSPMKVGTSYKIGVSPRFETQRLDLLHSGEVIADMAKQTFQIVMRLPLAVYETGKDWYEGNKRSPNSVTSIIGVAKLSGDIAKVDVPFNEKVVANLMLFASLNMALFIFNLLPFTPLDGGHILTCVWEAIMRLYYKYRYNKEFGYVDNAKMMPLTYIVVGLLGAMTIFLMIVDIFNPLSI